MTTSAALAAVATAFMSDPSKNETHCPALLQFPAGGAGVERQMPEVALGLDLRPAASFFIQHVDAA